MKILKQSTKITFIFLISFLLQSCFIGKAIQTKKMRSEYTEENNAIPPEFGKNTSEVLLVQLTGDPDPFLDIYRKGAVRRKYKGEYEIVNSKTDINTAFPDKKKYRYVFDSDYGSKMGSSSLQRYYVYDRLIDKKYSCGAEFTYYAKSMRVYMELLNNQRIKNSN